MPLLITKYDLSPFKQIILFRLIVNSRPICYNIYCLNFNDYKYLSTGLLWITFLVQIAKIRFDLKRN